MKNCLEIKSILQRKKCICVYICTHVCSLCTMHVWRSETTLGVILTFRDVHQDQTQAVRHGGWGSYSLSHLADTSKLNLTRYSLYFKSLLQALLVSVIRIN